MKLGWPFSTARREEKSSVPLIALSQIGEARWGSREGTALTRDERTRTSYGPT